MQTWKNSTAFCLWPTKFVHKMLAWHLPHQLAAELVLVGVSAMVLLYSLLPWGKNQWLRTHGVILVTLDVENFQRNGRIRK